MGTRGLTAVYADGKYQIAQYGQWDHYPSGQGTTVLEFCSKHLKKLNGREKFKKALAKVQFSKDENELQSSTFEREKEDYSEIESYPYAGRDNGANILELVLDAPEDKKVFLVDSIDFVGDSLFCEWAYIIDLDKGTLEVFRGFQTEKIGSDERFASFFQKKEHRQETQYFPVKLAKKYDLDNLPVEKVFLEELEPKEE